MKSTWIAGLSLVTCLAAPVAQAVELRMLSAGAVRQVTSGSPAIQVDFIARRASAC